MAAAPPPPPAALQWPADADAILRAATRDAKKNAYLERERLLGRLRFNFKALSREALVAVADASEKDWAPRCALDASDPHPQQDAARRYVADYSLHHHGFEFLYRCAVDGMDAGGVLSADVKLRVLDCLFLDRARWEREARRALLRGNAFNAADLRAMACDLANRRRRDKLARAPPVLARHEPDAYKLALEAELDAFAARMAGASADAAADAVASLLFLAAERRMLSDGFLAGVDAGRIRPAASTVADFTSQRWSPSF